MRRPIWFLPCLTICRIRRTVCGQFTRIVKGRIIVQSRHNSPTPYNHVHLHKQNKSQCLLVHRIIALTWLGPIPPGCEVRHSVNGSLDNSVANLSYGSRADNERDKERDGSGWHTRVRRSDGREFASINEAAKQSGCHASTITAVCRGRRKSTGGYGWSYV
jgi:hypothetical protein